MRPSILRPSLLPALPFVVLACEPQMLGADHAEEADLELVYGPSDLASWDASDDGWLVSPALRAARGADRVAVLVTLGAPTDPPAIEARALADGTPVSEWTPVETSWSDEERHVLTVDLGAPGSDAAEIRLPLAAPEMLASLRWIAVPRADVLAPPMSAAPEVSARRDALRAELSDLGVVTREEWGASGTSCGSDSEKDRMAIHHTVMRGDNPTADARAIQAFHQGKGWCDVGYHFMVARDGSIYEGAPLHLRGTHVGNHNTGNIGIVFMGCFDSASACGGVGAHEPTDAMFAAAARLMARLSTLYGIPIDADRVKPHRGHSGASTACPGQRVVDRFDELLSRAAGSQAPPDPPAPSPRPSPSPAPGPIPRPEPTGATCSHSLGGTYGEASCSANYQCCGGRWRTRARGCGACSCEDRTGQSGCSPDDATGPDPSAPGPMSPPDPADPPPPPTPPPPAPAGPSCTHTFGGSYAAGACSAGYQCCDGRWRTRTAGCGACACTETTGRVGC